MTDSTQKTNEIRKSLNWLTLVGACYLVYFIGKELGVELYYILR